MAQSSIVTGNGNFGQPRFVDLFALDIEPEPQPEKPSELQPCPSTEKVVAPAPVMPTPAPNGRVKPVIAKIFDCGDLRRIMAAKARQLSMYMPTDKAAIEACLFALRIVMFDYREAPNYNELLEQVRIATVEAHQGDKQAAKEWYVEAKRELKQQREVKAATKPVVSFEPAVIVEPAPGLEPMVPTHILCRELMAAAPADIEEVAKRIVGTLKGDDRYATVESARRQLLIDAKARVIAVLVSAGVSPEEALRRSDAVKNACPIEVKKAAPTKATTSGPARPLTADELAAMLGKSETVESTAKPSPKRGKVRTPEQIALYHDLLKLKRLEEAAEKREREMAETKARDAKAAKAAAEALAAEANKRVKAKAAEDAAAKAEAKANRGKHAR